MIKAVLFDLGRVLVSFDFNIGYRELERQTGIPASDIPARIAETGLQSQLETGQTSPHGFYGRIADALDLQIPFEDFEEIWCSIFLPGTLIPEPFIADLAKTHRLVLVSNTDPMHFEALCRTQPILRHFERRILSFEVGSSKPDAAIFQAAVAAAGCAPEECFYTDDIAEYVAAARSLGIDAVQFQSADQLAEELRARGVIA